ncbi:hypothetical protein [Xylophilus sp.]|uniref:hypothetical protein n=1 Tax=Xylophilus sp. TaxID=2653893 RepID=UPI0013B76E5C|nr:hypothetical protein [Xylophilus sp.]KAF1045657.1 MAG: hypothetical protein GAK38_02949 [Xylophilus sp.]
MTLTPEMVEIERWNFEPWAHSHGYRCHRDDSGDYLYSATRGAWEGWLGSCEQRRKAMGLDEMLCLEVQHFRINGVMRKYVSADALRALIDRAGGGA